MKKLTNRQKQAIDTKLKIVRISMNLFEERGFDNITISDICEASDISVGAFYHHFPSKNSIIDIGYEQVDTLLEEVFFEKNFDKGLEGLDFLFLESGQLMTEFGWQFMVEAYRNLLSKKGEYTFRSDRFVYRTIDYYIGKSKSNGEITSRLSTDALSKEVMRLSRGIIFDWCIHQGGYDLGGLLKEEVNRYLKNR